MKSPVLVSLVSVISVSVLIFVALFILDKDFRDTIIFTFKVPEKSNYSSDIKNNPDEAVLEKEMSKQLNTMIQKQAESYNKENPNSELDAEVILQQVMFRSLFSAGLKHYYDLKGVYPLTFEELFPTHLSFEMFPDSKIPTDANGQPFEYHVASDRASYYFCYFDPEEKTKVCDSPSI